MVLAPAQGLSSENSPTAVLPRHLGGQTRCRVLSTQLWVLGASLGPSSKHWVGSSLVLALERWRGWCEEPEFWSSGWRRRWQFGLWGLLVALQGLKEWGRWVVDSLSEIWGVLGGENALRYPAALGSCRKAAGVIHVSEPAAEIPR